MSNNNGHLEHIYERSQKLTEALYRVTDLFSDSEPLKWLLRRDGVEIFESILKIKTASPNDRIRGLAQIAEKIRQTIKVFELAASGSFISDANFQVLKREYMNLAEYLTERRDEILPEPSAMGVIGQQPIGQVSNGQDKNLKGHTLTGNKSKIEIESQQKNQDKKLTAETEVEDEQNSGSENSEHVNQKLTNSDNNDNGDKRSRLRRQEEITSLIKEKDWTSVGELADVFRGRISEKTLQRDLVGMASEGLLLKEGEKRWRRYKLAQT